MLLFCSPARSIKVPKYNWSLIARHSTRWSSTSPKRPPLRVLFCGADDFSIYSLRALHALQKRSPDVLSRIDVVCRPDKRVGRGLKQIQSVPIKAAAQEIGLPLHQIDTFTGWTPPTSPDLIITVSFGLLVPARLLTSATYGGLNVHPSLLPDLRGPAPIQHALQKQRQHTGVSLQTMHPTKFDHGVILSQSRKTKIAKDATPHSMIETLGPIAANLLVKGIEDGIFMEPHESCVADRPDQADLAYAPKIKPNDRMIDWKNWTAYEVWLRDRVFERLWDSTIYAKATSTSEEGSDNASQPCSKRITFAGPWETIGKIKLDENPNDDEFDESLTGRPYIITDPSTGAEKLGITTIDGGTVIPATATIEGEKKDAGVNTLIRLIQRAESSGQPDRTGKAR